MIKNKISRTNTAVRFERLVIKFWAEGVKMKLVIVIEGESADDLFACGVKDLMNHFLPTKMGVATKDIKKCFFEEVKQIGRAHV